MYPECMYYFQQQRDWAHGGFWTLLAAGFRRIKFQNDHVTISPSRRWNTVFSVILPAFCFTNVTHTV